MGGHQVSQMKGFSYFQNNIFIKFKKYLNFRFLNNSNKKGGNTLIGNIQIFHHPTSQVGSFRQKKILKHYLALLLEDFFV